MYPCQECGHHDVVLTLIQRCLDNVVTTLKQRLVLGGIRWQKKMILNLYYRRTEFYTKKYGSHDCPRYTLPEGWRVNSLSTTTVTIGT